MSDRIERLLLAAQEDIDTLGSELEIAERERDRYRTALEALLEVADDMRCYVPDYFAQKWDHDAGLDRARKALGL